MNVRLSIAQIQCWLYAGLLILSTSWVFPVQAQDADGSLLQQAEQAMLRAQQADADQYAPDLIEAARQTLIQAQGLASSRNRSERAQAPQWAERAAVDADLAYARSMQVKIDADLRHRRDEIAELQRTLARPQGVK
ncbi:MAG: DUF4398 domain-containing protein [Xanthomonadaceae bacterium]|jgi:hypothetical protein|nr:DUF4398 domain-containing protein [Xanthomonadaceae bacterium]